MAAPAVTAFAKKARRLALSETSFVGWLMACGRTTNGGRGFCQEVCTEDVCQRNTFQLADRAGTAYISCMQYTLRNIPAHLDRSLRQRARASGQSLNEIVLEALIREAGLSAELIQRRDLTALAGKWVEDPEFDAAIRDQDSVDPRIWK